MKMPPSVVLWGVQPFVQTVVLLVVKQTQFPLGTLGFCLSCVKHESSFPQLLVSVSIEWADVHYEGRKDQ